MKHILREGDTLARLGGDEFVAVLLDLEDVSSSKPMLNRLLSAAAQPVVVGDHLLQVSASLGITFYPQHEEVDADQLLRQADQAMYQAKLAGKNRFHFFDTEQAKQVRGQHETLDRMRMAMIANEFLLYFQPKVNMRTGMVIGAEALIRWQHPERGLLPPGLFLPDIEDTALAVELGEWVIGSALRTVERWRDQFGLDLPVSVNLGARQLQQRDFALRLREILAFHPSVRPGDLELEVLETSALEDLERVSAVIRTCQEMGVKFALDDFGTGYSSLTYLKRLSVDQLKIDQSFVRDMLDDSDDLAILEGVIGLATAFRRKVIAEGVETINHGTLLLQLGCELAQGYGIARPMPADDLPGWIRSWRPDPAWLDCQTVRREQLPILFACTEHRAWVSGVSAYIRGEREAPPTLDTHECDFGQWLDSEGREQFGAALDFRVIERRHHEIHALASDLCALHHGDCSGEARLRLVELKAAQDALIDELLKLLDQPVS
jgi:EAL domain-containing protein (putative c-di-GMP-specific phosphodiesterase class I)